jgi:23S rRNA (cytosine1962-C5)-methyltransferase
LALKNITLCKKGFFLELIKLKLRRDREKTLSRRHPWIFSGALENCPPVASALAELYSNGQFAGLGFYQAGTSIALRMFYFGPQPSSVAAVLEAHIKTALTLRAPLLQSGQTNCCRLIHAEGDYLPGLIVDGYHEVASVQVLVPGWLPYLQLVQSTLAQAGFKKILWDASALEVTLDSEFQGKIEEELHCLENNILFAFNPAQSQKTGLFLDQRENREWVGKLSAGRKVLNCFSYHGGFSLYAARGGAQSVHSVDVSEQATKACQRNFELNFPQGFNHEALSADCFDYLRQMPANAYDLIILDPPAFAKSRNSIDKACRGYKDINLQAMRKAAPGSLLFTFSCSQKIHPELFQKIVFGAAEDAKRNIQVLRKLSQGPDHPFDICHPEGEYLKGLILQVQ